MDKIINGKEISNTFKQELKDKISTLKKSLKLVVIQIGHNPASDVYVGKKGDLCKDMGIDFSHLKYDFISENDLVNKINVLNHDVSVTGILVQLPLPKEINETRIIESIDPNKDVDGLTSKNLGRLFTKQEAIIPCTALGVMKLLEHQNVDLSGKDVVIIGRTKLVGLPLIALLLEKNATVTICHSKTNYLKEKTSKADVLIVAIGQKEFIKQDMMKSNAILIDVGINRENKKLHGDIAYDECLEKCSMITPVPGGVGPMTVMMLINNIIECYELQNK